jgi:hypothetical protein
MEIISMKNEEALEAWDALSNLSKNADIPSFQGRYAVSRAFDKLKEAVNALFEEKNNILKKYYDLENGMVKNIKEGMSEEDSSKELQEFFNSEIKVEVYQIRLSSLRNACVFNQNQEKISMPAIYLSTLKKWIIDDISDVGE